MSDIKKIDAEKSIMELSCYAMAAISTVSQNDYPVVLSLPINGNILKVSYHDKHCRLPAERNHDSWQLTGYSI